MDPKALSSFIYLFASGSFHLNMTVSALKFLLLSIRLAESFSHEIPLRTNLIIFRGVKIRLQGHFLGFTLHISK